MAIRFLSPETIDGNATFTGDVKIEGTTPGLQSFIVNGGLTSTFGLSLQYAGVSRAVFDFYPTSGEIRIGGITTGDEYPVIYSDGVASLTFGLGAAPSATFVGNVGIGVAPIRKFDVNGTSTFYDNVYITSSKQIQWEGGNYWTWRVSGTEFQMYRGDTAGVPFKVDTSNNATFAGTLDTSGNITAATAGNTFISSVSSGDWAGMKIQCSDAASSYLFFYDTTAERARIQSTASNDLKFYTNGGGSLALTLDSSTNATFYGEVTFDNVINAIRASFVSTSAGATVVSAEGAYAASGSVILYEAKRSGGAVGGDWSYDDATTDMSIGTNTNHPFALKTNNTRALTIDTSQNSTFAGNILFGTDGTYDIGSTAGSRPRDVVVANSIAINTSTGGAGTLNVASTGTFGGNLTVSDGSLSLNKSDGAYISLNHNSSLKGYLGIANQVITGGSTGDIGLTATTDLVFGSGGTTERMRIDSSGNVGIGTTSPSYRLDIESATDSLAGAYIQAGKSSQGELQNTGLIVGTRTDMATNDYVGISFSGNATVPARGRAGIGAKSMNGPSGMDLVFMTRNAGDGTQLGTADVKMTILSGGNVGIGTTGPGAKLDVNGTILVNNEIQFVDGNMRIYRSSSDMILRTSGINRVTIASGGDATFAGNIIINTATNGGGLTINGSDDNSAVVINNTDTGGQDWRVQSTGGTSGLGQGKLFIKVGGTETAARLFGFEEDGSIINVLIGTTTSRGKLTINSSATSGYSNAVGIYAASDGGTYNFAQFLLYGTSTLVGSITSNGTVTAYNTTSDYRLKEDLQDFNGLDKVSKISVYDFKWKTDKSRSYGVMAHELEEVLPDAVTGEKDAEENQMVDYSKIVPLLVKSIQELKAEMEELKSKQCNCKCK